VTEDSLAAVLVVYLELDDAHDALPEVVKAMQSVELLRTTFSHGSLEQLQSFLNGENSVGICKGRAYRV